MVVNNLNLFISVYTKHGFTLDAGIIMFDEPTLRFGFPSPIPPTCFDFINIKLFISDKYMNIFIENIFISKFM